ncbi:unnamed protein product [Allacma fusca]|uniref:Cationic amino acid transporter C-terminal domain-containing protein n=1 Tax=Allacma fusca TaxID=39272 RepID=A0A8J2JC11_9HEXA|nr:unnamed protein product [Allacma fusca]
MTFKLFRRKLVDRDERSTELNRVLSTVDLTLLGIGGTLGIGIYVLAGSVAKSSAGPAVILSFFVAAFASVLAGLCYAEFGARVPKAGSAYVYSYVCVGELIAFIVGWNLIMEYVIGVASVAKGYSGYVDSLTHNHSMKAAFESVYQVDTGFTAHYFDFFAFGITFVLTLILAFGVKESSLFNNVFTSLNLIVVTFVIIAGAIFASPSNWFIKPEELEDPLKMCKNETVITSSKPMDLGNGGFAPFGFSGIMKGAATCFYGFVGFDCIATTGEEAKNPQRSIPLAIIFSLIFIFLAYFGISTVLTMMVPYFCQDADAPLPFAFQFVGFHEGRWVVITGAIFGLSTSLLGAMFPMPRVIYAMASDGLLFAFLAKVHPRFQTPLVATFIGGIFGGLMAALFDLEALIDMMSIGTLTAYTLVAVCVLILRYRKDDQGVDDADGSEALFEQGFSLSRAPSIIFNAANLGLPTELTSRLTQWIVVTYCIFSVAFCAVAVFAVEQLEQGDRFFLALGAIFLTLMITCLVSLSRQPVSRVKLSFKVPLVPLIPGFSIMANIYLIMELSGQTWIRFAVWMLLGFIIYGACLCSGRTDQIYKAAEEAYQKKRRHPAGKVSIASIGNTQIELHDHKRNGNSNIKGSNGY